VNTVTERGPYQGVLQILHFNWRMYLATAGGISGALLTWPLLPPVARTALSIAATPALFWMAASLLVSHYVYDCFPLYDLHWLSRALAHAPHRWINIHAGLDETSRLIEAIYPDALGEAVDIFDSHVMTETSIRQAQGARRGTMPVTPARFDALPFENATVDTAFAIFAAHELRRHEQRVRFFKEIARILTTSGEFVLMEHARDAWNFLAFGPGFLHFFPQSEWREAARQAGLAVQNEFRMTPFVNVFIMRRAR
jgi:SAM-dependent methyltransferase